MICVEKLRKQFATLDGNITALDDVSFKVRDGEFVSIMGSSGSGKTTLLNMLGGLDTPDSGSILIDGEDITKIGEKKKALLRRRKIGVIYQFYNLISELNVRENITLPIELDGGEIDEIWLNEILETIGLSNRQNAYPDTLSGGQQQRVAIARALFVRPSLILADEPTGNLDADNSREVLRIIGEMNKKWQITIIAVTHSREVADAADRMITLENGKITGDRRKSNGSCN